MKSFVIVACLLHAAFAAPQLITFKDGKVGVNFFGYHAEAGLGGGQNSQNGLLGGLHASAGTPWGQNAAAGLGGNVNGRAAGVLYAGAQAIPDVGAGVVLGGDTSQGGYGASEAYVPGKTSRRSQVVKMVNTRQYDAPIESNDYYPATEGPSVIQKVRPVKKYRGDEAKRLKTIHDAYEFVQLYVDKGQQTKPEAIAIIEAINKTTVATPSTAATKGVGVHNPIHSTTIETSSTTAASPATSASASTLPSFVPSGRNEEVPLDGESKRHNLFTVSSIPDKSSSLLVSPKDTASDEHNSFGIEAIISSSPIPLTSSAVESASASASATDSLTHLHKDNYNGNFNDKSTVVIRQHSNVRTQLRNRPHRHQLRHPHHQHKLQRRLHLNQDRQRSKTIVRTVGSETHTHDDAYFVAEEPTLPQNFQQQTIRKSTEKRQLIAPDSFDGPAYESSAGNANPNVVNNALQIPIGILQSLQTSLGAFH